MKEAVSGFLAEQLNKKLEPERKNLEKAELALDQEKIEAAKTKIEQLEQKYILDNWMDDAANRMASQLKFGTHISKGVHPDSRGDNVYFRAEHPLPDGVVGSQVLKASALDANGNAAALPLAAFFNYFVGEESSVKLRDLIQNTHSAIQGAFAETEEKSQEYATLFKAALDNDITNPVTYDRNKQLLWPLSETAIQENRYICLVPLYPSALTHSLYQTINEARYSEANKQARESRKKKSVEQRSYLSINELAITKLGGTKPQNISQLISSQGGRNYLLPSLPPKLNQSGFSISKIQTSFFNNRLRYFCRFGLNELFEVIQADKSTMDVREQRKQALDMILGQILGLAASIQESYMPGWSKDYQLDMAQKFWLDPGREVLEGEETFAERKASSDWVSAIEKGFSLWLNKQLKDQFRQKKYDFGETEYLEWMKEMRQAIKASQRNGQGVFE